MLSRNLSVDRFSTHLDDFKTHAFRLASRVQESPRLYTKIIATYVLAYYLISWYCEKTLSLAVKFVILLRDDIVAPTNPSDYSQSDTILVLGLCTLAIYLMTMTEWWNLIRRPREWRGYVSSLFGIAMFATGLLLLPNLGFYITQQEPLFIFGAAIVAPYVAYIGGIPELVSVPVMLFNFQENRARLAKALATATPIIFYAYLCLNLAAWPSIIDDLTGFLVSVITITALIWWFHISLENSDPATRDRRLSALGGLLIFPFIFYAVTRVMFLYHYPEDVLRARWDISLDFMDEKNPFYINGWPIEVVQGDDTRWQFIKSAILNSVRATLVAIFACTIIGTIVGVSRLSSNRITSGMATAYVEIFRNTPLAVLLYLIFVTGGRKLPQLSEEANIREYFYYSNKTGFYVPGFEFDRILLAVAILSLVWVYWKFKERDSVDDSEAGLRRKFTIWVCAVAIALGVILSGDVSVPKYVKPNLGLPGGWGVEEGTGFQITVEFAYLIAGLIIFTAASVAEIVRGSIQSLPRGQVEAAVSLGLSPYQRLRLVILPQALRSIVPQMNSTYMNVWKNSSLALLVGYNDVFYVIFVYMNNVGKLIPLLVILLLIYQAGSLTISAVMNLYNYRVTKVKI